MPTPIQDARASTSAVDAMLNATSLQLPGNDPFLLAHHAGAAGSYEVADVDGEPRLIPCVSPIVMAGGVNGVGTVKKGEDPRAGWARAIARATARGAIVLDLRGHMITDPELLPAGLSAPSAYLRDVPAQGGRFFSLVWDTIEPSVTGSGAASTMSADDRNRYNRWKLSLLTAAIVPPPSRQILADLKRAAANAVKRARSANGADRAEQIARATEKQRRLNHALAALEGRDVRWDPSTGDDDVAFLRAENERLRAEIHAGQSALESFAARLTQLEAAAAAPTAPNAPKTPPRAKPANEPTRAVDEVAVGS